MSSRSACARTAASDLPDSTHGITPRDVTGPCSVPACGSSAGACSRITCALVPLMPNEETPARRGPPVSGHERCASISSTAPAVQSTWVEGSSMWRLSGSTPWRIASTILMTPATPAAAWV